MNAGRQPTTESSHAVKNISGNPFSRIKRSFRRGKEPARFHGAPARPGMRWKRTGSLALALVGLFFVAVAEHNSPAISKIIKRKIFAALKDPLNLLGERSPGERGPRVLLSIKGPHERVLSTVRERGTPLPPAVLDSPDTTAAPEVFASIPVIPPEYDIPPQDQSGSPSSFGSAPFAPFFPGAPPNSSGITPSAPGVPPGDTPPPGSPPPPSTTSDIPPVTITLPEPATWAMMILGLFAIGVAARRQMRK
jgi:hypothetical protein